jgi:hypothetical protein
MVFFSRENDLYKKWLDRHPNGFFVGCDDWPREGSAMRLHKVSCSETGKTSTHPYSKACSISREELETWAKGRVRATLLYCEHCNPQVVGP